MDSLISRQVAIDAINKLIDRFERILRDIRETNEDESVCGLCEYDGAFIGVSGDWCNECPGFDKADCFKLSDERRKKWLKELDLPSAETHDKRTETHACDCISRQANCYYCHEDTEGYVEPLEKNGHAFIRFGMDGWELSIKAKGWHGSAKIRYCPMCGRDLYVKKDTQKGGKNDKVSD